MIIEATDDAKHTQCSKCHSDMIKTKSDKCWKCK